MLMRDAPLNRDAALRRLLVSTAEGAGQVSGQRTSVAGGLAHGGSRGWVPRLSWATAGVAAALAATVVVGNISLDVSSAHASDLLQAAAAEAGEYADLVPGSGQYLYSHTHARWPICSNAGCEPDDRIVDVYMPADPDAEWVLFRDWGKGSGDTGNSVETLRAVDGRFYDEPWGQVDYDEIPTDAAAAYQWVDEQYTGGSASRDEDNFVRIAGILRTGLVPAAPRAALLGALSRIPGVSATEGVANLDGVTGVAIGRDEAIRFGERQEIIIDPATGLVIGERTLAGVNLFGWNFGAANSLTAVETTVVSEAP